MKMHNCIVRGCKSNTAKHPNLHFFGIPKDTFVKDEWMDVLFLQSRHISDNTRICELHFRDKDFCATTAPGRKVLKHHALPVLNIGKSSVKNEYSDDEFMQCGSDSDPEIVEVKKISKQMSFSYIKEEPKSPPGIKQEPVDHEPEPEVGRRPSRRAAQLAAKKIHNTVRSFALNSDISIESSSDSMSGEISSRNHVKPASHPRRKAPVTYQRSSHHHPKSAAPTPKRKFRDQKSWHSIRAPLEEIDLTMECHEELLSAPQAEALMKAQTEYNNVMKMLRTLKASNVRIICEPPEKVDPPSSSSETSPVQSPKLSRSPRVIHCSKGTSSPKVTQSPTVIKAQKSSGSIMVKPANLVQTTSSGGVTVVPVHLVTVQPPGSITSSKA